MKILAIESSCDETAAAIVEDGRRVLSNVVATQVDLHTPYGGVIPEMAAREHLVSVPHVVQLALDEAGLSLGDVDAFAATLGPGLIGSLLIGAQAAKTLSVLTQKPFIGVHHLQAHVASNFLDSDLEPPFLCLLVSGGHTQLIHVEASNSFQVIGETLDDAVGEAYDKLARLMGLGYPGGPKLDALARQGNPRAFVLPEAKCQNPYDFSFSGLKTAVAKCYEALPEKSDAAKADVAASFQACAVKTLLSKTLRAAEDLGVRTITVAGGVAANSALRNAFEMAVESGLLPERGFYRPELAYCTDNAAMVAAAAYFCPWAEGDRALQSDVFSRGLPGLAKNKDNKATAPR